MVAESRHAGGWGRWGMGPRREAKKQSRERGAEPSSPNTREKAGTEGKAERLRARGAAEEGRGQDEDAAGAPEESGRAQATVE